METLHLGHHGFKVELLQRLLNKAATRERAAGTPLAVDGSFGPLTEAAVRAFQTRHRPIVANGSAGPQTWSALGLRYEVEHRRVVQFGQPTGTTCWSAAATIILGNQSVGPGNSRLVPNGALEGSVENLRIFASGLGWRVLNYNPGIQDFVNLMQRTPLWMAGGGSNWGHAVAISGVWSDGDSRGDGSMIRIHDPWPPNVGRIYGSFANPIMLFDASGAHRVAYSLENILVPQ